MHFERQEAKFDTYLNKINEKTGHYNINKTDISSQNNIIESTIILQENAQKLQKIDKMVEFFLVKHKNED